MGRHICWTGRVLPRTDGDSIMAFVDCQDWIARVSIVGRPEDEKKTAGHVDRGPGLPTSL